MKRKPVTPGEMLKEEFMDPLNIDAQEVGALTGLYEKTISSIVEGREVITNDIARRLGDVFDMSPQYWLNLQRKYDSWKRINHEEDGNG